MSETTYLVVFVPELAPELRALFAEDLSQFENGCFYLKASEVEFLGAFVRADLIAGESKEAWTAWVQTSHVLAVMSVSSARRRKLGF